MPSYLVTYDLIKRKNYPELLSELQKFDYWHCLGSVWIVQWTGTAEQLARHLYQHIDGDDKLLVAAIGSDRAWTQSFPQNCKDWLRTHS